MPETVCKSAYSEFRVAGLQYPNLVHSLSVIG